MVKVYHISRCRPVTIEVECEEEGMVEVEGFFASKNVIDADSKQVVLKSNFDRAISLLKEQGEVLEKIIEPGDGYAYGYFGQEYTEKIKAMKSETEEFLEECK